MLTRSLLKQKTAWKFGQVSNITVLLKCIYPPFSYREPFPQLPILKARAKTDQAHLVDTMHSWLDLSQQGFLLMDIQTGKALKLGFLEMILVHHMVLRDMKNK